MSRVDTVLNKLATDFHVDEDISGQSTAIYTQQGSPVGVREGLSYRQNI